ncbi:hypothetical protein AX27061_1150 [Achromobacter xylosoxidans NBRC 15126 = ATCC 27061]|nr:hypothetical protein AX27061_1150 [Achromobacter xylosoxidans NBRC 15126 = ATCC 27061]
MHCLQGETPGYDAEAFGAAHTIKHLHPAPVAAGDEISFHC